jgi:hypothetical protein
MKKQGEELNMDNTTTNHSTAEIIAQQDMARRVAAGTALPLLPEGVPGPVQHAERWWAVQTAEQDYRPVVDPEQLALLNRSAATLARTRAATLAGPSGGDR